MSQKYRIWSKRSKCYTSDPAYPSATLHCQSTYYLDQDGKLVEFVSALGGDESDCTKVPLDQNDYVIQLYTGLKDKNKKEVYDGDIVEWGNLKYLVEWESNKWQARCPYYHRYHHPKLEHFRDVGGGIIVGNVFENNELLK